MHLIEATRDKMKGFDLEATKKYYESIADKAWQQVKEAGTPEEIAKMLDEKNNWMMLDRDYPGRMQNQILAFRSCSVRALRRRQQGRGSTSARLRLTTSPRSRPPRTTWSTTCAGCRTTWSPSQTRCPSPGFVGRACTLVAAAIAPVPVPVHAPAPEVDDDPEGEVA